MYSLEPVQLSRTSAYAQLLSSVFSGTKRFTKDYIDWLYQKNPAGPPVGFDAMHNEELVAHYVAIPVNYQVAGSPKKALLSLNTVTRPDHGGKGLFKSLAQKTYDEAARLGFDFVVGVANQQSTHGFVNKLGFSLVSPLDTLVGLGTVSSEGDPKFQSSWSSESLAWRLSSPIAEFFEVGSGLMGIKSPDSPIGVIGSTRTLETIRPALPKKIQPFKLWIGIDNNIKTKGILLPIPEKLKPSPLNLIYKSLSSECTIPTKNEIKFELIDFDAF